MKTINTTTSARLLGMLFLVACMFASFSCFAPAFSELQSARLLGPGNAEISPSYSRVDGGSDHVQNHYGVQAGIGILKVMDFRFRYEYANVDPGQDDAFGVNMMGFGPKLSLVRNWLAIYVPVGFAFGEDIEVSETWQAHPTLLFTVPFSERFEINTSVKALIPLHEDSDPMYAVNLGVAISSDVRRWAVRPEIGVLFECCGGSYMHASLGLSLSLGSQKR
jgi:hypothetical protein